MNGTDRSTEYLTSDVLETSGPRVTYRAMCSSEGAEVLWHRIRLDVSPVRLLRSCGIDIATLLTINHHNILRLRDAWYDESQRIFHYITEFPPPQTLVAYIKNVFGLPSNPVLTRWCFQIIEALEALHAADPPIVHGALSCENIFIDPGDGLIKIGLPAIEMAVLSQLNPLARPRDDKEARIEPKSDIWLFGLCVIEMTTGQPPYAEFTTDEARRKAINERQMPRAFGEIHDPLIADLILTCLSQTRAPPTMVQLKENPLFADFSADLGPGRNRYQSEDIPSSEPLSEMQALLETQAREKQDLLARHKEERRAYCRKVGYRGRGRR
jgi:WNK lysine deficient protein kinase